MALLPDSDFTVPLPIIPAVLNHNFCWLWICQYFANPAVFLFNCLILAWMNFTNELLWHLEVQWKGDDVVWTNPWVLGRLSGKGDFASVTELRNLRSSWPYSVLFRWGWCGHRSPSERQEIRVGITDTIMGRGGPLSLEVRSGRMCSPLNFQKEQARQIPTSCPLRLTLDFLSPEM